MGIDEVPELLTEFLHLTYLDLSENKLTSIPAQLIINNMMNLTQLYLDFNLLKQVPPEIRYMARLKVLSLNYNDIDCLPDSLSALETLQYLGIKGNPRMNTIPYSISELPSLMELKHSQRKFHLPMAEIQAKQKERKYWIVWLLSYLQEMSKFDIQFEQQQHWVPNKQRMGCVDCKLQFTNFHRRVSLYSCGFLIL